MNIEVGMTVKYTPKWCGPGEEKYRLLVLESYEDVKKCKVMCMNSRLTIKPVEWLDWEMVEEDADFERVELRRA